MADSTSSYATPNGGKWTKLLPQLRLYMPAGRPLAEPPLFDYDDFVESWRDLIPSDARLKRLFAEDVSLGYRWRDETTERLLLSHYRSWSWDMSVIEDDTSRRAFYEGLVEQLHIDFDESEDSVDTFKQALESGVVTYLGYWEYRHLDDNGGTKALQEKLKLLKDIDKAASVFQSTWADSLPGDDSKEIFEKHGRFLLPAVHSQLQEWYAIPLSIRPSKPSGLQQRKEDTQKKGPWSALPMTTVPKASMHSNHTAWSKPSTTTLAPVSQNADILQLQEELDATKSDNVALKKRITQLESLSPATKVPRPTKREEEHGNTRERAGLCLRIGKTRASTALTQVQVNFKEGRSQSSEP